MSSPQLGVLLPTRQGVDETIPIGEVLDLARAADEAGVESLWVGDSLFARPRLDPLGTLTAVAAVTRRCLLGTAVLVAPMWNPMLLARTVATLDQVAGGRLVLGVGAGPSHGAARKEFAALGVPFSDRLGRLAEIVDVCRGLWADGPAEHSGPRWSLRDARLLPRPTTAGGPPVWLGGSGPRTLAEAARRYDGWLPVVTSPAALAAGLEQVRTGAAEAGRDPESLGCTAYLSVAVDEDQHRAGATVRGSLEQYYAAPWKVVQDLQDTAYGPATVVGDAVRSYQDAGAQRVILRFCGVDVLGQWAALADELG